MVSVDGAAAQRSDERDSPRMARGPRSGLAERRRANQARLRRYGPDADARALGAGSAGAQRQSAARRAERRAYFPRIRKDLAEGRAGRRSRPGSLSLQRLLD